MNTNLVNACVRDLIHSLFSWTGLTGFSKIPIDSLYIITFHRVLPDSLRLNYPLPGIAITPKELRWVLEQLNTQFDIATISDCVSLLKSGSNDRPLLAVTFDDGQWDNYEYARPVLSSLKIPATFYVATDFIDTDQLLWHDLAGFWWMSLGTEKRKAFENIGIDLDPPSEIFESARNFVHFLKDVGADRRGGVLTKISEQVNSLPEWSRMMTWKEVETLNAEGHEIGSHSLTHNLLSQLSHERQFEELNRSQETISQRLGVEVTSFCYPDGRYNQDTLKLLLQSSYQSAVTTQWGSNSKDTNLFQLSRFDINAEHLINHRHSLSSARLKFRLSRYQRKP